MKKSPASSFKPNHEKMDNDTSNSPSFPKTLLIRAGDLTENEWNSDLKSSNRLSNVCLQQYLSVSEVC